MMQIDLLSSSIALSPPRRIVHPTSWLEHIPFAFYLVSILKPTSIVELGTHTGVSYCGFCQAVDELELVCHCHAIDTWQGDEHAGFYDSSEVLPELRDYHDPLYGKFSRLIQSTFDEALHHFADKSIDLLHIDGEHSYDAVKHDFETWKPKVSDRGVILFHDINVRERNFGVWKLWSELKENYPNFEFIHGHGLGVLGFGCEQVDSVKNLLESSNQKISKIRDVFSKLGYTWQVELMRRDSDRQRESWQAKTRSKLEDVQTQLYQAEALLSQYQSHLQQTESALDESLSQLQETCSELERYKSELERYKTTESALDESLSQLQETCSELERYKSELERYKTTESALDESLSQLQETCSELERYKSELERYKTTESALDESLSQLQETRSELERYKTEVERLRLEDTLARTTENELDMQYNLLLWDGWQAYRNGDMEKMAHYLKQSLKFTSLSRTETILNWLEIFSRFSSENGYHLDIQELTNLTEWQHLCALRKHS
jgi:predicted O-methyltransferase YrrM